MNAVFNIIIYIVLALIAFLVIQWVAGLLGIPAAIVQLIGVLIFLYVAFQLFNILRSNPPRF